MEHNGRIQNNTIQFQPQLTSQSKSQFKWRIITVYLVLIFGLLISGVTAGVLSNSATFVKLVRGHFMTTMILTSLLMTLNSNIFKKIPFNTQKAKKTVCWIVNCVLTALPMLKVDPPMSAKGLIYTLVLVCILSLLPSIVPKKVIESYLQPLTIVHSLVMLCTVYSVLFNSIELALTKVIMAVCLYGGFLVYAGLFVCNTQRLYLNAKHPNFDPMFTAFIFYMNVINLYSRIAVFAGRTLPKILVECEKVCKVEEQVCKPLI